MSPATGGTQKETSYFPAAGTDGGIMRTWLQRLRGALGIGAIWGLAGTAFGALEGIIGSLIAGGPLLGSALTFGLGAGSIGFVLGISFAAVLTLMDRRRTLGELSPGRAAVWGAMTGVAMPLLWLLVLYGPVVLSRSLPAALAICGSFGALSAALAGGTVSLARIAPSELASGTVPDDGELLGAPSDG